MERERRTETAFLKGPNGFRMIDGRELDPTIPTDLTQIKFDEIVEAVLEGNVEHVTFGFPRKPTALAVGQILNTYNAATEPNRAKLANRLRQNVNISGLSGLWRGVYWKDGVQRPRSQRR